MVFYHNLNPVAFSLFGLEVRWYGIIFVIGFIIAYYFVRYLSEERNTNLSNDQIDNFFLGLIIAVVAGARIFDMLIYNFNYLLIDPLELFKIWHGGLSFHGGLIGAIIWGFYFTRKHKVDFFEMADILVIPLALGLMLGRIANFINGELVGRITSVPWAVKFEGYDGFRHPSQVYEAFKNLAIFVTLWNLRKKHFPKGFLFWMFVLLYGILRFIIEFFRAPDSPHIGVNGFFFGWMTMGQILNTIMVVLAVYFLIRLKKKN